MPGRVKCGGTEGEIVVAHGCRNRKKLICGTEGEIVVAHGRLPSPTRLTMNIFLKILTFINLLSLKIQPFKFLLSQSNFKLFQES